MTRPTINQLIEVRALAPELITDTTKIIEARRAHEAFQSESSASRLEIVEELEFDSLDRLLQTIANALGYGLFREPEE